MAELIEWEPVDTIAVGAIGEPGQRTFLIQARKDGALLSVHVEKEQVVILAAEADEFLDHLASDDLDQAELHGPPSTVPAGHEISPEQPLFRARLIGIGYDPDRHLILIELREHAVEEGELPPPIEESSGYVARLYATRAQMRAMAEQGVRCASAGRPPCPLCGFPINPEGHPCPRWN